MVKDDIMKHLNKNPDAEWPAGVLAETLGYTGSAGITTPLNQLIEEGRVVRVSRGVYRSNEGSEKPASGATGKAATNGEVKQLTFKLLKRRGDEMLLLGSDGDVYAARPFSW